MIMFWISLLTLCTTFFVILVICILKGDVKANFKIPFAAFGFEAKERKQELPIKRRSGR
jgi:hypothetical protein